MLKERRDYTIHIPLLNIAVPRKLNAKRLLVSVIIVMLTLTSLAVIAVRQARAAYIYGTPWWFLPTKWHFEVGIGSNRTMIMCAHPANLSVPSPITTNTTGKVSFDLNITAPDESGLATITVPAANVSVEEFYILNVNVSGLVFLWGELYATGDGSGTLATVDNALDVDVFTTVTGHGDGTSTVTTTIGDGTPDPAGSSLVYLPFELHIWMGESDTDPTFIPGGLNMTTPFPIYVTTGFTKTTIDDSAGPYPPGSPSMDGYSINGTGVPFNPYNGTFTGVATGGGLDLYAEIVGTYIDFLFKETMASEPDPPIIPGDFNGDGYVYIVDFVIFAGPYGTLCGNSSYNPECDLDCDCDIDVEDFTIFAGNFRESHILYP